MAVTVDLNRYALVSQQANWSEGVALVHLDCKETVVGGPMEGLGTGEEGDNTLDRLVFLAGDHDALYCKGPSA